MADERFDDHMSSSDALMWTMEIDPVLRSTITAAAVLDRTPRWDDLVARLDRASRVIPRMRQRAVEPPARLGPPRWVVDESFDLGYHVRRVRAPWPGSVQSVLDLAATWAMAGFDRERPLWEFTLVEGLEGGQAVLLEKVHHAVTDGVGGMRLAVLLGDLEREPGDLGPLPEPPSPEHVTRAGLALDAVAGEGRRAALAVARRVRSLPAMARAARHPSRGVHAVRSAASMLTPATATLSPVMSARSLRWRYDVVGDVPVDELKAAAALFGGTLNDAFVGAVTGGLRRYHERHGTPVDGLRMMMPLSIRADEDALGGNRIVPIRVVVPVGIADPAERLPAIAAVCRPWRTDPALGLTDVLASVLNHLPPRAMTAVFGGMLKHVDFVTTNVPGIPFPVYMAGALVERYYALPPPMGAACNVSLLSHAGTCCIGITSDAAAIPDRDVFMTCLDEGFAEVLSLGRPAQARLDLAGVAQ